MGTLSCGGDDRAIESTVRYELPEEYRIVVDQPFDQAWNVLIRRLSESSFRVSMLEKASRFVALEHALIALANPAAAI